MRKNRVKSDTMRFLTFVFVLVIFMLIILSFFVAYKFYIKTKEIKEMKDLPDDTQEPLKNGSKFSRNFTDCSKHSECNEFSTNQRKLVQIHWIGRFGNRIFQYVFGCHYAHHFGTTYYIPSEWEGTILFKPVPNVKIIPDEQLRLGLNQSESEKERHICITKYKQCTRDPVQLVSFQQKKNFGRLNVYFDDLHMMYFPWIFESYSSRQIRSFLQFREEIVASPLYQYWYKRKGTYDVAHVRRGDIISKNFSGSHSAISIKSYERAMRNVNVDPSTIIWVSDDPTIRTPNPWHQYCHDDWKYPTGQVKLDSVFFDFLPDFLTMIFARNLFRGNSSLSWWAGFLSEGNVYSPVLGDRVTCRGLHFIECDFVRGNHPHFMGAKWEGDFGDIVFGHT